MTRPVRPAPSRPADVDLRTMSVLAGRTSEPVGARYEITLKDRQSGRTRRVRTSAFTGRGRIDLEDACEWGGFDRVVVRRRRGRFGAGEAQRVLTEIVEDLTYDHPERFYVLEASEEELVATLEADLEGLRTAPAEQYLDALTFLFRVNGLAPTVERISKRWTAVSVGPDGVRRRLWVQTHGKAGEPPGRTATDLVIDRRSGDGGGRAVSLAKLLDQLHRARIGTLELELRTASSRERAASRRSRAMRGNLALAWALGADAVATRKSWRNLKPPPKKRVALPLERDLDAVDLAKLSRGFVPQRMEDHWFALVERDRLYMHRSWTGLCVFVARLEQSGAGARLRDVEVTADRRSYRPITPYDEAVRFAFLVDHLLLRRRDADTSRLARSWKWDGPKPKRPSTSVLTRFLLKKRGQIDAGGGRRAPTAPTSTRHTSKRRSA